MMSIYNGTLRLKGPYHDVRPNKEHRCLLVNFVEIVVQGVMGAIRSIVVGQTESPSLGASISVGRNDGIL